MNNSAPPESYYKTFQRLQHSDTGAASGLRTLLERGSLAYLEPDGYAQLTPELVRWLLKAESHEGSELLYLTSEQKVRLLTLSAFFNYPEHYQGRMQQGAFLSVELENGASVVLYLQNCSKEEVLNTLESARQNLPLTQLRPLNERLLEKLQQQGHLSYLSREGRQHLNPKLMKYLDYAVNVRPGSELIYQSDNGFVNGEALEEVIQEPEKYAHLQGPFYLTLEVGTRSVIFDTLDLSRSNLWHLKKKADQIAQQKNP